MGARKQFWMTAFVLAAVVVQPVFVWADTAPSDLAKQVTIRRTEYGVPHIVGPTLEAVAFGLGYCQAEDHCVTIMEHILRARGELASVFGGKDNVESDFWNRQFRVRARAIETFHKLDADFRSMLRGFAAGYSYYVALHREELPDWVEPITAHDVAAHGMTGVMRFAFDRGRIVRDFKESLEEGGQLARRDVEDEAMGSNMWALAPSRTESGHAILMGNPHQPWNKVATYYEAHLTVPGKLNFYGSTFIGRPVLTTGFNEHLGWSHTVNYPDLEEIYELRLDPRHSDHYLFDGGPVPITTEEVQIEVMSDSKGQEAVNVVTRSFEHTPLGPVIHRTDDHIYVLKSVAYEEFRFYQQWLRLAQAKSFDEFRKALDILAIPMFNICYADRDGNIYYLWNGTIPDIPHPNKQGEAVPAAATSDVWTRVHPIAELPQLLNPDGGYVHNSNSAPYLTNLYAPMARDSFPDHFPDNRFSLRSQHSALLLHGQEKFSLEDVRDLKFSARLVLADRVKDDLLGAFTGHSPNEVVREGLRVLRQWDNTARAESRGAVLFAAWWEKYSDELEQPFAVPWQEEAPISTPRGLAGFERARETFAKAVEEVKAKYGALDVAWGAVHRVRRGDVDLPATGADGRPWGSFRVLRFEEADDGKRIVNSGDSWIFTVEFGPAPKAYTVVGYSQSGNPESPHHSDQTVLYAQNRMKRAAFTEAEIDAALLKEYHPGLE